MFQESARKTYSLQRNSRLHKWFESCTNLISYLHITTCRDNHHDVWTVPFTYFNEENHVYELACILHNNADARHVHLSAIVHRLHMKQSQVRDKNYNNHMKFWNLIARMHVCIAIRTQLLLMDIQTCRLTLQCSVCNIIIEKQGMG